MINAFTQADESDDNRFEIDVPKTCPKCGSEDIIVRVIPAANQARLVCHECGYNDAIRHNDLTKYRNTTAQSRWAKRVKARDGNKCILCGRTEPEVVLHAHHVVPVRYDLGGRFRYVTHNGVTLCEDCHNMAHGKIRRGED